MKSHAWRTLARLTVVVAGSSMASLFGLLVFRQLVPVATLHDSSNEVGNYLQTIGGIYAVLLAFVVYVVWGQFNDARGYVEREGAALVDLYRLASGLPDSTRTAIQSGLRDYVDAVVREEWEAMGARDEATIERVGSRIDHVWDVIHRCDDLTECQHAVYSEVLSRFNDLTDVRTNRLTSARARVPIAMKLLLYSGGILTVGSMYLLSIDRLWLHGLVTAALAGAVAHILFLILDLDDPFDGNMQVAKAPFERAKRHFDRDS